MVSMIVAHDLNRVIGKDNKMPWDIPEDLAYFKEKTMGKAVVMGRKTFESIGKPLPGRLNIVVTRNRDYDVPEGVAVTNSVTLGVLKAIEDHGLDVFVIGGAEIYKQLIDTLTVERLYVTEVQNRFEGDAYFPEYEDLYTLIKESKKYTSKNGERYSFKTYKRSSNTFNFFGKGDD